MIERCLSVRQPSAWAICAGTKKIENRTWDTPYRGRIAIHASSSKTELNYLIKNLELREIPVELTVVSAIIGVADLVDVAPLCPEFETEWSAIGPICWKLENPCFLSQPIPMKGKLNLFTLTSEIQLKLAEQLQRPAIMPDSAVIRDITAAIKFDPMELLVARSQNYFDASQDSDARRLIEDGIANDGQNSQLQRMLGFLQLESNDPDGSLKSFDRAIAINPDEAPTWFFRASALTVLGRSGEAEQDLNRARELDEEWFYEVTAPGENDDDTNLPATNHP